MPRPRPAPPHISNFGVSHRNTFVGLTRKYQSTQHNTVRTCQTKHLGNVGSDWRIQVCKSHTSTKYQNIISQNPRLLCLRHFRLSEKCPGQDLHRCIYIYINTIYTWYGASYSVHTCMHRPYCTVKVEKRNIFRVRGENYKPCDASRCIGSYFRRLKRRNNYYNLYHNIVILFI